MGQLGLPDPVQSVHVWHGVYVSGAGAFVRAQQEWHGIGENPQRHLGTLHRDLTVRQEPKHGPHGMATACQWRGCAARAASWPSKGLTFRPVRLGDERTRGLLASKGHRVVMPCTWGIGVLGDEHARGLLASKGLRMVMPCTWGIGDDVMTVCSEMSSA